MCGVGQYTLCGRTVQELPSGAYSCHTDNFGNPHFHRRELQVDELIDFPGSLSDRILKELARFWTMGDRFARFGFLHRRGYLFWGKQGCGKSSLIHMIVSRIVEAGHVAFFCEAPYSFIPCMQKFRQVEPERPVVCIFEDIEAIIEDHGDSQLLQWLDGNHQVSKSINLASTNYPEKLDKRIISRPRRFDRIHQIESPDVRLREAYFARKMPEQSPAERKLWVRLSDGLPFAALAEMIISVCCLGNGLEETTELLRKLDAHNPTSQEYQEKECEEYDAASVN
jgi:SpoVK/Ycf46/Vps4 family AAA+-type ATPase